MGSAYNENRSDAEGFSGSGQDPLSTQRRGTPVGGSVGAHPLSGTNGPRAAPFASFGQSPVRMTQNSGPTEDSGH